MKKKPISLIITVALFLSTIGGAIGYNSYIYQWDDDHSSCHENNSGSTPFGYPGPYGGPSYESASGNISGIVLNPVKITVGMEFTLTFVIRGFTEVIEYPVGHPNYDPDTEGRDNETMVGISGGMGDNADFMRDANTADMLHGVELNETGDADDTGGYSAAPLALTLRAPFAGGNYEVVISAVAGLNHSNGQATNFTYALGSIILTVYTSAPAGVISTSGDDDDDDDDAEGAISGYILIITLATIFSISAVLLLRMKKLIKNKSRNV